jgi:hypothetical protein
MLQVWKSFWRDRWHVYEVDTGGTAWLATFRHPTDAIEWVRRHYADVQ